MKKLRTILARVFIFIASKIANSDEHVWIVSQKSFDKLVQRMNGVDLHRPKWDHAFDLLTGLMQRMDSFEQTTRDMQRARQELEYARIQVEQRNGAQTQPSSAEVRRNLVFGESRENGCPERNLTV